MTKTTPKLLTSKGHEYVGIEAIVTYRNAKARFLRACRGNADHRDRIPNLRRDIKDAECALEDAGYTLPTYDESRDLTAADLVAPTT